MTNNKITHSKCSSAFGIIGIKKVWTEFKNNDL